MKLESVYQSLLAGKDLSRRTSKLLFLDLFRSKIAPEDIKTLLLLLAKKGETSEEVLGAVQCIREIEGSNKAKKIKFLMDTCGTGGDGSSSLNVSTLTAFVIAGAGGKVAKHGNRSISSACGSSDLMKALGVRLEASKARMVEAIHKVGIGYFHAPYFHPIFAGVQPIRQALGVRTIFNLLGPFLNPMALDAQLVGVARKEFIPLFSNVFKGLDIKSAMVCHSGEGMDEISTRSKTTIAEIKRKSVRKTSIDPQKLGFKKVSKNAYRGGDVKQNTRIALDILKGKKKGAARDIVVLNAAAGLKVSGIAKSFKTGILMAKESLDGQKAYEAMRGLVRISNK